MSERYAFRMRLKPGAEAEYERRHDALWPELEALLREAGISDYSIYHDEETGNLFGILSRARPLSGKVESGFPFESGLTRGLDAFSGAKPVSTFAENALETTGWTRSLPTRSCGAGGTTWPS